MVRLQTMVSAAWDGEPRGDAVDGRQNVGGAVGCAIRRSHPGKCWRLARQVGPQPRQPLVPAVEPEVVSAAARGGAQAGPRCRRRPVRSAPPCSAGRRRHNQAVYQIADRLADAPTIVVTGGNPYAIASSSAIGYPRTDGQHEVCGRPFVTCHRVQPPCDVDRCVHLLRRPPRAPRRPRRRRRESRRSAANRLVEAPTRQSGRSCPCVLQLPSATARPRSTPDRLTGYRDPDGVLQHGLRLPVNVRHRWGFGRRHRRGAKRDEAWDPGRLSR